jgi:endonuclease/exonuclease/phosphatase family metal-dependent hydrolase
MQDTIKGVTRLMLLLLISSSTMTDGCDAVSPEPNAVSAVQSTSRTRILTWNVKGGPCSTPRSEGLNMRHFKDAIDQYNPAVLILQEVHKDQAEWLANHLVGSYKFYFVKTQACGNKTDYGDAFVSRLNMTDLDETILHPIDRKRARTPAEIANGANPEVQRVSAITVEVNGKPLRLYNVHLSARNPEDSGDSLRYRELKFILDYIHSDKKRLGKKFKPVVAGDFNTPPTEPHSAPYSLMRKEFKDAWVEGNQNFFDPVNPNGWTERRASGSLHRIDYIFVGADSGIKVEQAGVIGTPFLTDEDNNLGLSDHRPVIAYLAYE